MEKLNEDFIDDSMLAGHKLNQLYRGPTTGQKVSSAALSLMMLLPNACTYILKKYFYRLFSINSKNAGHYITTGNNILKFPLLVSSKIDQNVVSKFCALLQQEKAEYIRTYFFNNDFFLGYDHKSLAKEFDTKFYESVDNYIQAYLDLETDDLEENNKYFDALVEKISELAEDIVPDYLDNYYYSGDKELEIAKHNSDMGLKAAIANDKHAIEREKLLYQAEKDAKDLAFKKYESDRDQDNRDRDYNQRQQHHDAKIYQADKHHGEKIGIEKEKISQADKHHKEKLDQQAQQHEQNRKDNAQSAALAHARQMQRDDISHARQLQRDALMHKRQLERDRLQKDYVGKGDQFTLNDPSRSGSLFGAGGLKLSSKDLMPISPTMVNLVINKRITGEQHYQIVGVRYIPHAIPFYEMKVAFKYGAKNSRLITRFLSVLSGNLSLFDLFVKSDQRALAQEFTKISVDKKAWNLGLKDSTHAVTMVITKEEYNDLCANVVDLNNPAKFKYLQKDVGLLDLIILDKDAKEFIRINAFDNYQPIKHDIREALSANGRDLVINARIDANKLSDEV